MASRSMKAAVRRGKNRGRHRRHTLASVNSGTLMQFYSGPNREEMGLMKNRTGNTLFRNPKTGQIFTSNKHYSPEFQAFWEARYPAMKYSNRELKERGMPDEYGLIRSNPVPRGLAMRRAHDILIEEAASTPLHYRIINTPEISLDIFLNSARTRFFLFELNRVVGTVKRSEIYSQEEIAIATYNRGKRKGEKVHWAEVERFDPEV